MIAKLSICVSLAFVLVSMINPPAMCSISGVLEDFSGDGPHDGFFAPDWKLFGTAEFEQVDGTLRVLSQQAETSRTELNRQLLGQGSFRSVVEFSDLELGGVFSQFGFTRILGAGGTGGVAVFLRDRDNIPEGFWGLQVLAGSGQFFERNVPRSTTGKVRLVLDFDDTTNTFNVAYDGDHTDDEASLTFVASFAGEKTDEDTALLINVGSAKDANAFAAFDYLSIVSTDSARGDFSGDGLFNFVDFDMLMRATRIGLPEPVYDLDESGRIDVIDHRIWITEIMGTYIGDANLDGEFASSDLVNVFSFGEYEDDIELNSTWSTGDWNGDGDFTTSDLVLAFQGGGYEQGPRIAAGVPEPFGQFGVFLSIAVRLTHRRRNIR